MSTWTIGGILTAALALSVILGFVWGRRRPADDDQPLGLPDGSVRALLTFVVCLPVVLMALFKLEVPEFLTSAFTLIIGLYFGARGQQAAQRATNRGASGGSSGFAMPATMGALSIVGVVFAGFIMLTCIGCSGPAVMKRTNDAFDARDRKVAGVLPHKAAIPIAEKVGLSGAAEFMREQDALLDWWDTVPDGTPITAWLERRSTGEVIPWNDLRMRARIEWDRDVEIPQPTTGGKAPLQIVQPMSPPAVRLTAPNAPAASTPPAGGGASSGAGGHGSSIVTPASGASGPGTSIVTLVTNAAVNLSSPVNGSTEL